MTLASEIETVTDYNSTDVSNAVTEATNYCAHYEVTADEIIKTVAIWLLQRQTLERQHRTDPSVVVPDILQVHDIIKRLKGTEVADVTKMNLAYKSPAEKGLSAFTW